MRKLAIAAFAFFASFALASDSGLFRVLTSQMNFSCSSMSEVGCSGVFPPHETNTTQVGLLTNGEASLAARVKLLESATQSIRVQALIFTADEAGLRIAEILKRKKAEGKDVRVIVDSYSNLFGQTHFASKLVGWQTQWMYFDLKQHHIEVEGYEAAYLHSINEIFPNDPLAPNKRYHDKMLIVDAELPTARAIVGGMNIANEYFRVGPDAGHRWRDQDVIVSGSVISDITAAFERNFKFFKDVKKSKPWIFNTDRDWKFYRRFTQNPLMFLPRNWGVIPIWYRTSASARENVEKIIQSYDFPEMFPANVRFIQNRPRFKESYIHQAYVDMISSAKDILIANAYFIPKRQLVSALKDAVKRGATVKILTNSKETNDTPFLATVSRYYYQPLLEMNADPEAKKNGGNISIYEWNGPAFSEGTIHAKFAVFDRVAGIVGSYNLDPRSELWNSETVLAFESEALASRLSKQFLGDDLGKAKQISFEEAVQFHKSSDAMKEFKTKLSLALEDWM